MDMTIDFSDMLDDEGEAVLPLRDIFFTLNRDPQFSFPRDIQTEVMNRWFDDRDRRDNIIKLNVGSGKTLVGLLVLQSSLNEKKGPALFIAPDKQLAAQVIREAKALGIDVVDDPQDPSYAAGERICVINVYKLFNGKSVFGVGSSQINIGSVVIDDAHACASTITGQFRIKLDNTHAAYAEIFSVLAEDLKGYNAARFLEVKDGDPHAYVEVPFWSWASHQTKILSALHDHRDDNELQFVYPLLKELLPQCRCVIGGQYLEIDPHFPTTDIIQSFRHAKRRIFMTAMLSDDSVLVTHFGADPGNLAAPIVPASSQSMGERMILMPQELNPDLNMVDVRAMLKELAEDVNVVIIVPSETAANEWKAVADKVLMGEAVVPGIEKLRNGHVGLTVLVNRYDGIDLPGDACRVLVLAALPEVSAYSDLVDSEVLSGSAVNLKRQIERIEQGMGRGIRSNDDYCAVLLLGAKLVRRIRSPEGYDMLTPATRAQFNLSRRIARELENPSADEIQTVIQQCLKRDSNWIKFSKKALVGLTADNNLSLDPGKLAIRAAFDCARRNQHNDALTFLDKAINAETEDRTKAWLLARKAVFQHPISAEGAQKTLIAANGIEPSVLKPMHGVTYKKLSPSIGQQAGRLIEYHQRQFIDPIAMQIFVSGLCNDLQFAPLTANLFEAAVNDLASFLGIIGQRPEKEYGGDGPDNLWALPNGPFLVIECKNGVTAGTGISKKDVGQLGQSVEWFKKHYLASSYVPIMVHPEKHLGDGASLVSDMRVIVPASLEKLREHLRGFAKQIADPDIAANASKVAKCLAQFELNATALVNAFSKPT